MRAQIVGGPTSRLHGAKCGLCPHAVTTGQAVLYKHLPNVAFLDDRLVFHVDCMAALVDRAPRGVPARGDARVAAHRIRVAVAATGDPYARADVG